MGISEDHAIISLKRKISVSGADQKNVKLGYDLLTGDFYYKKKIYSNFQELLIHNIWYKNSFIISPNAQKGFAEIGFVNDWNEKRRYWEKKGISTLKTWLADTKTNLTLDNLLYLQDAIKCLHSLEFKPAVLGQLCFDGIKTAQKEPPFFCYHGDLSPNNVIWETDEDGSAIFKLIDYSQSGKLDNIVWTPGWGSPEYVAYAQKKGPYTHLSARKFNQKFGQKKDAWSLGLLFGSILKRVGNEHLSEKGLPCFSFVAKRVIIGPKYDDSEICNIEQHEIDENIQKSIELAKQSLADNPGLAKSICAVWKIINTWLTVNPEERPTINQSFLSTS